MTVQVHGALALAQTHAASKLKPEMAKPAGRPDKVWSTHRWSPRTMRLCWPLAHALPCSEDAFKSSGAMAVISSSLAGRRCCSTAQHASFAKHCCHAMAVLSLICSGSACTAIRKPGWVWLGITALASIQWEYRGALDPICKPLATGRISAGDGVVLITPNLLWAVWVRFQSVKQHWV